MESLRSDFNAEGIFSCEKGWTINYTEPIYKSDLGTFCKADGRWKNEEFVYCIPGSKLETKTQQTLFLNNFDK